MKHLHAVIRGQVQMVNFRYFVVEQARALELSGWVRNGDDGRTVEVVAEGLEERLLQLEAALHEGPHHARVEAVETRWSDTLEAFDGFQVRL